MRIEQRFQERLERSAQTPQECDLLTESTLWAQHGSSIWKPKRVLLNPSFYPVYQWRDLYSYSFTALMLKKGQLDINPHFMDAVQRQGFQYWGGNETPDKEITRIGQQHDSKLLITSPEQYAERITDALREDIRKIEESHPSYTNLVMCGGKDSLNLLLFPWKNPTIALSAAPNYDLVCEFVAKNKLPLKVMRLEDPADENVQDEEALLGNCRMALDHWRWGTHLQQIAKDHQFKAVFWKGQVADLYTTPKWKAFIEPPTKTAVYPRKIYKRLGKYLPENINLSIGRLLQPGVIRSTWTRCAAMQGTHMEFLRELTGCLFLSAYHGPAVRQVWCEADLASVAQTDMRPLVGRLLAGRDVIYPDANPAPPPSTFRIGLGSPDRFFKLLDRLGFPYSR